ncbi:unnamed protein product [Moneuplotes crassus]|uniref:Anaphase-promoting complex subunit 4 n=1 Tax=Euplotes crassus TaxID=5936 RepID=A0AAD1YAX3_EUPCR|nr:unnamed protein product [Moneuplotes crassus]
MEVEESNQQTFSADIGSVVWCPSMELYGVIAKDEPVFEIRRCDVNSQAVFPSEKEVSQFMFMDDKALRTIIAYKDSSLVIVNTDDGTEMDEIMAGKSPITAIEVMTSAEERSRGKKSKKGTEKYLLPIEFKESTKKFKRKLRYLEGYQNPVFCFVANEEGQLSIYMNGAFPVTHLSIANTMQLEGHDILVKKMKTTKDLSKLFMLSNIGPSSLLMTLDTRFLGYKSGAIHAMAKLIYESNEYVSFIQKNYEQCWTFFSKALKKYNAELFLIEKACLKAEKALYEKQEKKSKDVREDLKMMIMYSHMTKGFESYLSKIATERKELVKRDEIIQTELEEILKVITKDIMTSIEVILLKLSTLRSYSLIKEKYQILGLDTEMIDQAIEKLFVLYAKSEQLNLNVVEAKLNTKNFYTFINKLSFKIDNGDGAPDESEYALNPLNKIIYDSTRLLKFLESDKDLFKMNNLKSLLEKSSGMMSTFSKTLDTSKTPDKTLMDNLVKAFAGKKISDSEERESHSQEKISSIVAEIKEIFQQIYKLPESRISKYYQPLQKIQLTSSENDQVLDFYVDSFNEFDAKEESKLRKREVNLCDRNGYKSDVITAVKYCCRNDINVICIYFQRLDKKLDLSDSHSINLCLYEIPENYDITEAVFHTKNILLGILRPWDDSESNSYILKINLEKAVFKEISTDDLNPNRNNSDDGSEDEEKCMEYNLEEFVKANFDEFPREVIQSHDIIEKINDRDAYGLASSGGKQWSVVHKRRNVLFRSI